MGEFDLFAEALHLDGFALRESGAAFEIDVEGGKVVYQAADSGQLHLNEVTSHATDNDLVHAKYPLAEAIRREIERRRLHAIKNGFQKSLPGFLAAPRLDDRFRYAFTFLPNHYAAKPPFYAGRYKFRKHYYPMIHDLREKRADGSPAEEFACARAIDNDPHVRH